MRSILKQSKVRYESHLFQRLQNQNTAGDVFKAKLQRQETMGAETILEGGETEVEKPLDQLEAEEVKEEIKEECDQAAAGVEEGSELVAVTQVHDYCTISNYIRLYYNLY